MIAPLLLHELEIGLRQSKLSNHIGFGDFRRKGAHARSLRLGEDASRHLVLHPQAFHGRFPVPLGGQAIAPSGLEALAAARCRPPARGIIEISLGIAQVCAIHPGVLGRKTPPLARYAVDYLAVETSL